MGPMTTDEPDTLMRMAAFEHVRRLGEAEAILADLAADLTGTIQLAADGMAGRPA
jgi:hypothetical protein